MIRIVLENILLLLLPTLAYVLYVVARRYAGSPDDAANKRGVLDDAPLLYLFGAGVALVMLVLLFFGKSSGWEPGKTYVPPVYKDGKIQPGHSE